MKLSRNLRAGSRVMSGPSGSPPTGLRGFEVVDADPNGPPVLDRPQASAVHRRDGAAGWFRAAGAWVSLGALGALYAATNAFGYLIAIGPYLSGLIGSLIAGWRAPVVVRDAAYVGVSVTVAGLSSARRYRCAWKVGASGAGDQPCVLKPNGVDGVSSLNLGGVSPAIVCAYVSATEGQDILIVIEPRQGGRSTIFCYAGIRALSAVAYGGISCASTDQDYTSLTFEGFPGHLRVIEEIP